MRVLIAFAIAALGTAGTAPARATELSAPPLAPAAWSTNASWFIGERAEPVVIIDNQPGVVVRDYWLPPWHNHHYFPYTGRWPRIGRRENLSAHTRYRPAQSFYRAWSTNALREEPPPQCATATRRSRCAAPNYN